jgi:ABC-type bacteriocin/lantibiotic exporter with double-glycine peptidase domain
MLKINAFLCLLVVLVLCRLQQPSLASEGLRPEGDCGAISLAFCAKLLNVNANIDEITKNFIPKQQASMFDLANAAQALGLEAKSCTLTLEDLRFVTPKTPSIAHVDGHHFVVAWSLDAETVFVVEPTMSATNVPLKSFGRRWGGSILVLSKPGEQPSFPWRIDWLKAAVIAAATVAITLGSIWNRLFRRKKRLLNSAVP